MSKKLPVPTLPEQSMTPQIDRYSGSASVIRGLIKGWQGKVGALFLGMPLWKLAYQTIDAWGNIQMIWPYLRSIVDFLGTTWGNVVLMVVGILLITWQVRRLHRYPNSHPSQGEKMSLAASEGIAAGHIESIEELKRRIIESEGKNAELAVFKNQYEWLQKLAERDKSNISRYVYVIFSEVNYKGLNELDPYIEIGFYIINASVYDITIDKNIQDGAVYFNELKLNPKQTEVLGSLQHISRDDRGERRELVLQQWLTKDVAERVKHPLPGDKLFFNRLHLNVQGADSNQGIRAQRLSLPSSISIEE